MHWTLRGRAAETIILQVNIDMDELTTHGVPAHIVPGSCRAFLDLMQERADAIASSLSAGHAQRRAWLGKIKQGPRLHHIEKCSKPTAPGHPAAANAALRKVHPRNRGV